MPHHIMVHMGAHASALVPVHACAHTLPQDHMRLLAKVCCRSKVLITATGSNGPRDSAPSHGSARADVTVAIVIIIMRGSSTLALRMPVAERLRPPGARFPLPGHCTPAPAGPQAVPRRRRHGPKLEST